jgi:hypothetical protein
MIRRSLLIAALLATGSAVVLFVVLANRGSSPLSDPMPYRRLAAPREVADQRLPDDLRQFYASNEGVGLDSDPERIVRLCKLAEVKAVQWADLRILGEDKPARGWEEFAGYRVGRSSFGDEIIYVLRAPVCPAGSIFTLGPDVAGPGGAGPLAIEPSLVLSPNFDEWLRNMERAGWHEYGLTAGGIRELPNARKDQLLRYYKGLNPKIKWEDS